MYYSERYIIDRLRKAYQGEAEAREELNDLKLPHAFPSDYSEYMLVQQKKASLNKEGYWYIYADEPQAEADEHYRLCVELFRYQEEEGDWRITRMPLPLGYEVIELAYEEAMYWFTEKSGEQARVPYWRMEWFVHDQQVTSLEALEENIEQGFRKIMKFINNKGNPAPGKAKNHLDFSQVSLTTNTVGMVVLQRSTDEEVFLGEILWRDRKISITLNLELEREKKAMCLHLERLLNKLELIDEQARFSFGTEMLEIWNEHWLDEYLEEEPYTAEELAAHLELYELVLEQNQVVQLYYCNSDGLSFRVSHDYTCGFHSHEIG
ncbi:DUF2262 domain-containing protein [Paenibacillus xylanexedens]|uniref:DUF2262 domain-containing protein n=1 Tax=Paenibacillus xylanexedens TaxID=528191 RepID=UPI0011A383F7|nr:DUF2262 domain-containing protein [Paenibacillus xylanexedens]